MPVTSHGWFCESYEERTVFGVRVSERLFDAVSDFQRIEIFSSDALGNVLALDGCFMVTQRDHFIYHEMLVHIPMAVTHGTGTVLIIGGGDGGTVTEIAKYPDVESVTLCEIDPMVVSACRTHFPDVSAGLADPRVRVIHEDGAAFVGDSKTKFDLVLVDSTDPVGAAAALFSREFYESVRDCLSENGVAVFQTESPIFMKNTFASAVHNLRDVFGTSKARPYLLTVPSYPGGLWSFTFCSQNLNPLELTNPCMPPYLSGRVHYYNPDVHRAAFALPGFVQELLDKGRE